MSLQELPAYARLPFTVAGASGSELALTDGRRLLDLYGAHCVATFGTGDPGLGRALQEQWAKLSFATNLVRHEALERFLAAFEANLPAGDWSVFLSNSGAEANENALKAAFNATGRSTVVALKGGFHGRTAAAAAISDTKNPFPRAPFDVRLVAMNDAAEAEQALTGEVAAVVLEPIQSLAGVVEASPEYLARLRELCDRTGAVLVFDEVQTGNGRLGTPWASQHTGVVPDAFTTAKGAAGGLPIGITVLGTELAERSGTTGFGSTFGGGPTVLAAATLVAERIGAPGFEERVEKTSHALRAAAAHGPVEEVRGAGLLLGLQVADGLGARALRDRLLGHGILTGTCNDPDVLRLTPPLNLDPREAGRLQAALESLEVTVP